MVEAQTVALVLLLIAAFLTAFLVLKMLIETTIIAAISGLFYLGLVYGTGAAFSLQSMLTYAFLGVVLYISYSVLASLLKITSEGVSMASTAAEAGSQQGGNLWKKCRSRLKEVSGDIRRQLKSENEEEEDEEDSDVKEVVLGED